MLPGPPIAHHQARKAAELRAPYEDSVGGGRPADAELLAAYMAYIRVEEKQGDPARVQVRWEGRFLARRASRGGPCLSCD